MPYHVMRGSEDGKELTTMIFLGRCDISEIVNAKNYSGQLCKVRGMQEKGMLH